MAEKVLGEEMYRGYTIQKYEWGNGFSYRIINPDGSLLSPKNFGDAIKPDEAKGIVDKIIDG